MKQVLPFCVKASVLNAGDKTEALPATLAWNQLPDTATLGHDGIQVYWATQGGGLIADGCLSMLYRPTAGAHANCRSAGPDEHRTLYSARVKHCIPCAMWRALHSLQKLATACNACMQGVKATAEVTLWHHMRSPAKPSTANISTVTRQI